MQPRCPHCHQTLPDEPVLHGIVLRPATKRLFDAVKRAGPNGIYPPDLFELLYQEDPNGGPETGMKCLHARIWLLNRRLRKIGKEISSMRGRYGAYVLRDYKQAVSK